jgi:hypothetical protein
MSVYRRMKVTNLRTGQVYGYLGRAGLLREKPQKLYCVIESAPEYAGDIAWVVKESDLEGKVGGIAKPGFAPGTERPSTAEGWARMGYAYLATRNIQWDIAGEQQWLSGGDVLDYWAMWSWTSSYTRVRWLDDNSVTAEPDRELVLYADKCIDTDAWYLRWGKPTNPSVVRLDFE